MIITKTPFRMSFFGGGTDIPQYFKENSGAVISTTFDKYCYVTVRHLPRFFDYKDIVIYSRIERVQKVKEIEHPLVRESMKYLNMHELSITYDADLPARTGLGTSSAFAVGLLSAFHAINGNYIDKERLAQEAIYVERDLCGEAGGWQDQVAASFGGFNRIDFEGNSFQVSPIVISQEKKIKLNNNLMLFFTGFSRISAEIQKETQESVCQKNDEFKEIYQLVDEAQKILVCENANYSEFGKLLDYDWKLKRSLNAKISSLSLDEIYNKAIQAGAIGGKLLGAGGGGFFVFYVEGEKRELVREALNDFLYIPFSFEDSGSQILYYKTEDRIFGNESTD